MKYEALAFNLSRLYTYLKDSSIDFCIISACRNSQEATEKENKEKTEELEKIIRSRGWGYIPVKGGYIETRGNEKVAVEEDSFIVRKLNKQDALNLCSKFKQDAVLWKDSKGCRYLDKNGNQVGGLFSGFSQEKEAVKNYFTKIKRGKRKFAFIAEMQLNSLARAYSKKLDEYKTLFWNKKFMDQCAKDMTKGILTLEKVRKYIQPLHTDCLK